MLVLVAAGPSMSIARLPGSKLASRNDRKLTSSSTISSMISRCRNLTGAPLSRSGPQFSRPEGAGAERECAAAAGQRRSEQAADAWLGDRAPHAAGQPQVGLDRSEPDTDLLVHLVPGRQVGDRAALGQRRVDLRVLVSGEVQRWRADRRRRR